MNKWDGQDFVNCLELSPKKPVLISEDSEWGVKAVSTGIVDFTKAISGGDKAKLGDLRSAIKEGFKQAEKALGGQLPDISKKT